jgi:hypothetical protein
MKKMPPDPCVDAETLAAFVDGTLDASERTRVVAHLGRCADCARLVAEVTSTDEELREIGETQATGLTAIPTAHVAIFPRRRLLFAAGAVLAVAASVLLVVFNRDARLDPLVALVGQERMTIARPTGGFHYGPLRSPTRGGGNDRLDLLAEAARLRERATRSGSADDVHAAGVAFLIAGDAASAAPLLASAVQSKPDDASFHSDLGAVQMTLFLESGDQAHAAAALASFDRAIALEPGAKEAWFNRARLFELTNRPADAIAAWTKYLALSDEDGWRQDATRSLDALQRGSRIR